MRLLLSRMLFWWLLKSNVLSNCVLFCGTLPCFKRRKHRGSIYRYMYIYNYIYILYIYIFAFIIEFSAKETSRLTRWYEMMFFGLSQLILMKEEKNECFHHPRQDSLSSISHGIPLWSHTQNNVNNNNNDINSNRNINYWRKPSTTTKAISPQGTDPSWFAS